MHQLATCSSLMSLQLTCHVHPLVCTSKVVTSRTRIMILPLCSAHLEWNMRFGVAQEKHLYLLEQGEVIKTVMAGTCSTIRWQDWWISPQPCRQNLGCCLQLSHPRTQRGWSLDFPGLSEVIKWSEEPTWGTDR